MTEPVVPRSAKVAAIFGVISTLIGGLFLLVSGGMLATHQRLNIVVGGFGVLCVGIVFLPTALATIIGALSVSKSGDNAGKGRINLAIAGSVVGLVSLVLLFVALQPHKAGDACSSGDEGKGKCEATSALDDAGPNMLICRGGKFSRVACKSGCMSMAGLMCDISASKAGDPCIDGMNSCVDSKTMIACKNGKLVTDVCDGPNGCTSGPAATVCQKKSQ